MSYLSSERHFRRHESFIKRIVELYPNAAIFDVKPPITQSDVLARNIRYAGKSLHDNQWDVPETFPYPKFVQIWDEIEVSTTVMPGKVVCGTVGAMQKLSTTRIMGFNECTAAPEQAVPVVKLDEPSKELIEAVIIFHHFKYLSEPSIINTVLPVEEIVKELQARNMHMYDIAVKREGNEYTIL